MPTRRSTKYDMDAKYASGITRLDRWLERLIALTIVVVPFHAFLTVWASTFIGHFTLLRLWVEGVLLLTTVLASTIAFRDKQLLQQLYTNRLARLIALYVVLTVVFGVIALLKHEVVLKSLAYALVINLRFLIWLLCVWVAVHRSDWLLRHWRQLVAIPLAVVVVFGLLQFFVLPNDFLKHFGYNDSVSYVANVTLNQDSTTMRIQSFLRGSNPLGAYLVCAVGVLLVCLKRLPKSWPYWLLTGVGLVALFLTFSRSAVLGFAVTALAAGWYAFKRHRRAYVATLAGIVVLMVVALAAFRNSGSVQNALLHANDQSTASQTSNEGHESALRSSVRDLVAQPFGGGPGTAGQASVYNVDHPPRNTESYLLQLCLELGWPGIVLFGAIITVIFMELWKRRSEPLARAVATTALGLVVVNSFAYGWSDESLAFVWWGLAGMALAGAKPKVAHA